MRVALLVKGTAPDPEAKGEGTTFPAGKTEEGEEGGTLGVIVASTGAAGTLPTYPEDAGKRASRIAPRAESESFVGAACLATAPELVTGPVVRGALSERVAKTSSIEDWNSLSLN